MTLVVKKMKRTKAEEGSKGWKLNKALGDELKQGLGDLMRQNLLSGCS